MSSSRSPRKKTPKKFLGQNDSTSNKKTPGKTPKKSPGRSAPSSATNSRTPSGADRFIPNRSTTNFELGHFKLNQEEDADMDSAQREKERIMSENLHGGDINTMRILSYHNKAPVAPEGYENYLKVIYSQKKTPGSGKKTTRYIPQGPDRILDAPDILDDYYLNLIDWGANNLLAVALGNSVFVWNAGSGQVEQLMQVQTPSDYVCSVAWTQEGNNLAIGLSSGLVQIWDADQRKRLRTMAGHASRVGSLAWNQYILSTGCRTGELNHHDVRVSEHLAAHMVGHTQEVCGLKWSPDGKYLASGGNDNILNVWPLTAGLLYTQPTPLYSFNQHQAAVKALGWCPWQPNILASGGGMADRRIRFWNCHNGTCVNTIDTNSQVCALLWSTTYREIVSGHGFAQNQLVIWKYPGLTRVAELTGHQARVLHLSMSPDGSTVLSAGADETLRLWKCFMPDAAKKKVVSESRSVASIFKQSIR